MVKIEIDVSDLLVTNFQDAVNIYNVKHNTEYTPKQVLLKLLRRFTIDIIREKRIQTAQIAADEELEPLE